MFADTNSYLTGKDTSYPTTQYYGSPIRRYSVEIQKYLYNKLQWVKVLPRKKTIKKNCNNNNNDDNNTDN